MARASKNFHIITFGCQMNAHDSDWLRRELLARGLCETSLDEADIVIVNTCSVREKPQQKVFSTLGRIRQTSGGRALVAIAGCVAQQIGRQFFRQFPEVRLAVGTDGLHQAPAAIMHLLECPDERISLLDFSPDYLERESKGAPDGNPAAYVNIMQGCDNFCAYCIVPFTRGRQKSRQSEAIIRECQDNLAAGSREITLLGQNVNAYGRDSGGDMDFSGLLHRIAELPGLARLRYVTPHPADMTCQDIGDFAEMPQLCPRLHLPAQSGSDTVLKRMRRRYGRSDYLRLVEKLWQARPDLALSTDLIVGFPGESERDFEDTLDLVRQCSFMSSFSFCYSDRPGTSSALFADKVPREASLERLGRLQELQDDLSRKWLLSRVGQKTSILVEGPSPRQPENGRSWQGRDPYGAIVHLCLPDDADRTGQIIHASIIAAKRHSLIGEATCQQAR